ncbi:MAG: PD-(D/E)XK nuclease family protein [Archangium sp.]|nr:PD-(D/E)XK nuclease family protein [Archangium sp.]
MGTPSGSGLDRAELCPGSMVLPHLDSGEGDASSDHGRAIHRFLDIVAKLINQPGFVGSMDDVKKNALALLEVKYRTIAAAIDLSMVPHTQAGVWRSEQAMVFDFFLRRAEFLEVTERRYPPRVSRWQVFGTADLIGVDGDTVVVIDLKTGWGWRRAPSDSLQLLFYAITAAKVLGCSRARVGYMVLHDDDTVPRFIIEEVDEWALAAAEERIARVLEAGDQVNGDDPGVYRAGSGCRYCPSIRVCPAQVGRLSQLLQGPKHALLALTGGLQVPGVDAKKELPMVRAEDLPRLLDAIEAGRVTLKQMVEDVKNAVRAVGTIPMPNGMQLGDIRVTRDTLIAEKAGPVLDAEFGADAADRAIETKFVLTKSAVEELVAARCAHTGEKKAPTMRAVLEKLEEAGAVSTSEFYDVRVHKAPKVKK